MFKKFNEREFSGNVELETRRRPRHGLLCYQCLMLIAHVEDKIEIDGAHQHICTNPANQTFNLGCFKHAPGCTRIGEPTSDHTWFKGYSWRIALCSQCKKHLGWGFVGATDQFHGLILGALIEKG